MNRRRRIFYSLALAFLVIFSSLGNFANNTVLEFDNGVSVNNSPVTQMNNITQRSDYDQLVWQNLNLTGDSNASIAILSTGIDEDHAKFGRNSFGDLNFSRKIIGWQDFTDEGSAEPIDRNGDGTFIASAAFGSNETDAQITKDAQDRITATLSGDYYHPNVFEDSLSQDFFEISLGTFLIDKSNTNITMNATFMEHEGNYLEDAVVRLYYGSTSMMETLEITDNTYKSSEVNTTNNLGLYDVRFRYRSVGIPNPANFSVHCMVNFTVESPAENAIDLTGLAPETKIVSLRTLNAKKQGELAHLVDSLNWINTNADQYQIVGVTIANGAYSGSQSVNTAIDSLINKGILVVIAAGDNGLEASALNNYAKNSKALVVGAINDNNQLTYYSSKGQQVETQTSKPDLLAPAGSRHPLKRGIIAADTNDNDLHGLLTDRVINDTTIRASSSISASFVAAAYNLLIETIGGYEEWKNQMSEELMLSLKSYLLMTASETNQLREDDPYTTLNEGSSANSPTLDRGGKDLHEGYGFMNIEAAIEALNSTMAVGDSIIGTLSGAEFPSNRHVLARRVELEQNKNYLINLTYAGSETQDLDLYLYANESNSIGEPILIDSSTTPGSINESISFGTINGTTEYIIVVKAVSGAEISMELSVIQKNNIWAPSLSNPEVNGEQGYNDTLDYVQFSVNYTDLDDIPPILIYVRLNDSAISGNLTLTKAIEGDNNYLDGCVYTARHRFYDEGTYEYYFGVFDGNNYTRLPSSTNYTLEIGLLDNAVDANYTTEFDNVPNWTLDENWNRLSQTSSVDDRGPDYESWNMLYFGDSASITTGVYTYTTITASSTYSALSPQILTGSGDKPVLQFGARISINLGDFAYLEARANRTGAWENLLTLTNIQEDWRFYEFTLDDYAGQYTQIRFRVVLDGNADELYNRGIMLSSFRLLTNEKVDQNTGKILNTTVEPDPTYGYSKIRYSAYYCDEDGVRPDLVYLEIDGQNITMKNTYGDWNASYEWDGENLTRGGIMYHRDVFTGDFTNYSYQIHARSNGVWYKTANKTGPTITNNVNGLYPLVNNHSRFISYGYPEPTLENIWLKGTTGFHYIDEDDTWYCGNGIYGGYGLDWDCNLITPLIHVPTTSEDEYTQFLTFDHKLVFDPSVGGFHEETAGIYISADYGETWKSLGVDYQYNDEILSYEHVEYNLKSYRGKDIFIRFNFMSDGLVLGSPAESGWYLQNISVSLDEDEDRTPPIVQFNDISDGNVIEGTYYINISLLDSESSIDDDSVRVYLDIREIDGIESINGEIYHELDTTQYPNGEHTLIVYAYDNQGNFVSAQIDIIIDNPWYFPSWVIWLLVGLVASAIAVLIFLKLRKEHKRTEKMEEHLFDSGTESIPTDRKLTRSEKKAYRKSQRRLYELKVREEAENATKQSEAQKPFVLHCKECGKWFKSWDFEWICPNCHNDSLFAAYQCPLCNKWYFKDEPGEYYCNKRNCKIRLLK